MTSYYFTEFLTLPLPRHTASHSENPQLYYVISPKKSPLLFLYTISLSIRKLAQADILYHRRRTRKLHHKQRRRLRLSFWLLGVQGK